MNRKTGALVVAALLLAATGCEKRAKSLPKAQLAMMEVTGLAGSGSGGGYAMSMQAYADSTAPAQRFIAERHNLEIITPEAELQKSWESVVAFCGTIRCEVVTSTSQHEPAMRCRRGA